MWVFFFNKDVKFCSNPGFPASLFALYFYLSYEIPNLFYLVEVPTS